MKLIRKHGEKYIYRLPSGWFVKQHPMAQLRVYGSPSGKTRFAVRVLNCSAF
jgi:hypothetical protein